jgi:hypothetical protein
VAIASKPKVVARSGWIARDQLSVIGLEALAILLDAGQRFGCQVIRRVHRVQRFARIVG